mgnify:CR=1 FL=1
MSWVLGISDSVHDQSVALFKDKELITMIELERLTRVKHGIRAKANVDFAKDDDLNYFGELNLEHKPQKETEEDLRLCINYCLNVAGIKYEDLDLVIGSSLHFHRPFPDNTVWINHYMGHASNFYASPFKESAILVVDGYGDSIEDDVYEVGMFAKGIGNKIEVLDRFYGKQTSYYDMENSLGVLYRNASVLTGFNLFGQGKVMGLAALGDESLYETGKEYYTLMDNGAYKLDNKGLFLKYRDIISNTPEEEKFQVKANIASAMQHILEVIVIHMVNALIKKTNCKNLCIAGGIAINSVMNNKILQETEVENLYILPCAGDSGISIGSGLWGIYNLLGFERENPEETSIKMASYGKKYDDKEIEETLEKFKAEGNKIKWQLKTDEEIYESASQKIIGGNIVGWFRGGSEIGPRALGNRSMLADARSKEMKDTINRRIKHREAFRPFAPSILVDHLPEYFDTEIPEPFMLRVVKCKEKAIKEIPAIVHFDNTARVQTVDPRYNPDYYKLISTFYKKTGVPVVLDTSFNDNNEPIVESPLDALKCFMRTGLDALYLENWEVSRI